VFGHAIAQGELEFSPAASVVIPREDDLAPQQHQTPWSWAEDVDGAREDGPDPWDQEEPAGSPPSAYQPLALLPERILSLVLRVVVVLFILFALVTIAGSV
jgi:hypothetical protein